MQATSAAVLIAIGTCVRAKAINAVPIPGAWILNFNPLAQKLLCILKGFSVIRIFDALDASLVLN